MNRQNHQDEDISFKVSPYQNRIAVVDQYSSTLGYRALNQQQPVMRNQGQKKTLQKVLDKLNHMNAKLNLETLPSSHELHDQLQLSPSNHNLLRSKDSMSN